MKQLSILVALAALLAFSPVVVPSVAADLLVDDFDGYRAGAPVGTNTGGWLPLWNAVRDPASNIWTNPAAPVDGSRGIVMQLYGAHSGCWSADVTRQVALPADMKTKIYVQFDMNASGDVLAAGSAVCPENRYDIGARLTNGNGGSSYETIANLLLVGMGQVSDGRFSFDNALPVNRWYRVVVEVDRSTGIKRFWRDGAPWADLAAFPDPALVTSGSSLQSLSFTSGGGKGWIDRVRLFTDSIAPKTTATLAGNTAGNGLYTSDVVVTLSATDGDSGVESTGYSLDAGGSWTRYYAPFKVTAEGATAIDYRSVDRAGNVELFGIAAFSIARSTVTPPPCKDGDDDDRDDRGHRKHKKHHKHEGSDSARPAPPCAPSCGPSSSGRK